MKHIILLIFVAIFFAGCATRPPVEHVVYVDKYIPIPIVPNPPTVKKPDYYANSLTEEQKNDIGELGKAYVISSQEAVNYTRNLEEVYEVYKDMAARSENRLRALENLGATVDRSFLEQSTREINSQLQSLSSTIDRNNEELSDNIQKSLRQMSENP